MTAKISILVVFPYPWMLPVSAGRRFPYQEWVGAPEQAQGPPGVGRRRPTPGAVEAATMPGDERALVGPRSEGRPPGSARADPAGDPAGGGHGHGADGRRHPHPARR